MTPAARGVDSERRPAAAPPSAPVAAPRAPADPARLRRILDEQFDFVWRSLRRFGLDADRADDAAQQVFVIASRKLDVIQPGSERSFLFGTAMRVASDMRRSAIRRREVPTEDAGADLVSGDRPDELLDQRRAREMLDHVLDAMDLDLRSVFVLFELEEMSTAEIAAFLAIPPGTVASRLRRAREEFQEKVARIAKRPMGGRP
jgi:RNA polymerase sigma-70 factor (ECF subfamily)